MTEHSYRLLPMQQEMLLHSLSSPGAGFYVAQVVCRLASDTNLPAFQQAWRMVVQRYAILRTSFHYEQPEDPLQCVHDFAPVHIDMHDWRNIPEAEHKKRLESFLAHDREQEFDFHNPPVMRLQACSLRSGEHFFVWTYHHTLLDSRACFILLKELSVFYQAYCRQEEPDLPSPPDFRSYSEWFYLQDKSVAQEYWRQLLCTFSSPVSITLPFETQRPVGNRARGSQRIKLPPASTSALNSLARRHRVTANIIAKGIWPILLARYSGQDDIVFGEIRSCRCSDFKNSANAVGPLIITVPVRACIPGDLLLSALWEDLRSQQIAARDYGHVDPHCIEECSGVSGKAPLFDNVVRFDECDLWSALQTDNCSLWNPGINTFSDSHYPLALVGCTQSQFSLAIVYDRRTYCDAAMERMAGHFRHLLKSALSSPEIRIQDLSVLTESERHQALVAWNGRQKEWPLSRTVHERFEEQVERTPEAVALRCENRTVTYRELNRNANQLARHLRNLGLRPGSLAGIFMEPLPEMMVAILAVLKAGAAYVPLDPAYPEQRTRLVLKDAGIRVLLTQQALSARLPVCNVIMVCVDRDWASVVRQDTQNFPSDTGPEDLLYVIYTSGSTGQPKGAANYHRGFSNLLHWFIAEFGISRHDKMLLFSAIGFDLTQKTLFAPLLAGAELHLSRTERNPAAALDLIARNEISLLNCAPSIFYELLSEAKALNFELLRSLRVITVGGEPVLLPKLEEWMQSAACQSRIFIMYGPAECADIATFYSLQPSTTHGISSPPIGSPIPNVNVFVVDQHLHLVPQGVIGELCISGSGVGMGYLGDAGLTALKFVPDPFSTVTGNRLYRSGDMVRWRRGRLLEFIGRADHQVKIRGIRIELGEIEAVLSQHPCVHHCAVLSRDYGPGDQRLVAYFSSHGRQAPDVKELRRFFQDRLPPYMVPSVLVRLESLPLNSHGKVDRNALLEMEIDERAFHAEFVPPLTEMEQRLAGIWADLLKVQSVGRFDDFLELGGHSLLAMQLMSRMRQTFQAELSLYSLFEHSTLAAMARHIETCGAAAEALPLSSMAR